MKNPKLNFVDVFVLDTYNDCLHIAKGHKFEKLNTGISIYEEKWLVFKEGDDTPELIEGYKVFTDEKSGINKLDLERKSSINYYEEELVRIQNRLRKLKP